MLKNVVIMLCSNALKCFDYASKNCYYACIMLAYNIIHEHVTPLEWWERHFEMLPHWATVCKKVLLCQPSSAAVERVFSVLNSHFNHSHYSALEDYVETAVMLQYNKRD